MWYPLVAKVYFLGHKSSFPMVVMNGYHMVEWSKAAERANCSIDGSSPVKVRQYITEKLRKYIS